MSPRRSLRYSTYDVFTSIPFGGNPLAVVWGADDLPEAHLQIIAREFNYSETVFILKPKHDAHTARLRIFTPNQELPFAGHPTIGAIVALSEAGHGSDMTLELGVGPLAAHITNGSASLHATQSLEHLARPDTDLIARVLGLQTTELISQPIMATLGVPFTFTEVSSREVLSRVRIDLAAMHEGNAAHPSGRDFSQAVYWRDTQNNETITVHMRMFAPLDSIPEDPATGSAAATLAALMCEAAGETVDLKIHQGEDMGRPSTISAQADSSGVTIGGTALRMMEGRIFIP
jgi:trans-2,3-dihydro-3-hydroxyanthranilate isomerase